MLWAFHWGAAHERRREVSSSHNDGPTGNGHGGKTMSRAIQDEIGERLRVMYDDLKDEPVPDHLLALLKQLDKSRSDESS